jgi:hypothetical protein
VLINHTAWKADGGTSSVVFCTHTVDRQFFHTCNIIRASGTSPLWCMAWRQKACRALWGIVSTIEGTNLCYPICSYYRWPTKVASRLLQGVPSVALFCSSWFHCWGISVSTIVAECQPVPQLVRFLKFSCIPSSLSFVFYTWILNPFVI